MSSPAAARPAMIPDVTAPSTLPPSMSLRVQSPAANRFEKPVSPGISLNFTLPAGVITYRSLPWKFALQYCESKRPSPVPPDGSTSSFQSNLSLVSTARGQSRGRSDLMYVTAPALARASTRDWVSFGSSSSTPQK